VKRGKEEREERRPHKTRDYRRQVDRQETRQDKRTQIRVKKSREGKQRRGNGSGV
jgi:hypothetical protein